MSTPDAQDKKSPTILVIHHAASDRAGGELLYRSRLRHRIRPCRRSAQRRPL